MLRPENKISLSPLANQKGGKLYNGASVGFNRDLFFQKAETVFDKKFDYNRAEEESYKDYKSKSSNAIRIGTTANKAKGETLNFLKKHTGINRIKQEISPIQNIKKQLGVSNIPTRIPTSVVEVAYKVAKKIIKKGLSY
jgi:hypothetical protein